MIRTSFLMLLTALTFCSYGQKKIVNPESKAPFPYDHYVSSGIEDRYGNLWFGTSEGVYRYDGTSFTNYRAGGGLSLLGVSHIFEDKAGQLWFGVIGGIVRCDVAVMKDKGEPGFMSIKIPAATGVNFAAALASNPNKPDVKQQVSKIVEDKNGDIWFFAGYNVYRASPGSGTATATGIGAYLKTEKIQMSCGDPDDFGISRVYYDEQGNFLISTNACCGHYDVSYRFVLSRMNNPCVLNTCKHDLHKPQDSAAHHREIAASLTKITRSDDDANIAFATILKDKAGNMWAGCNDGCGVYKYDGTHFSRFMKSAELSKSFVTTIYEDHDDNIWFGTGAASNNKGNGVFRYSIAKGSLEHYTTKNGLCSGHPFSNDVVSSISEDSDGRVWFGGDGGACYYDPASKSFRNFTAKEGMSDDHVRFVLQDKTGDTWFGAWGLGLYCYSGKSLICFTESK